MVKISPNDWCPCDSGKKYKKCCRPYLDGKRHPPTPETVVRGRFTAYTLRNIDFLIETTHPESSHFGENEQRWRAELAAYCFRNFFSKLEILSAEDDKVSYKVHLIQFGIEDHRYIEHATFKQEDGKWSYYDSVTEDIEEEAEQEEANNEAEDDEPESPMDNETEES